MTNPGTETNPLRVAIVGSGPSGFYAAEALFRSGLTVEVAMFERLPTPFGLVRSGVAPDHPKLKQAIQVYEKIARTAGFTFIGNVMVGRDVAVEQLSESHHAVIFTCGAQTDRRLDIPGEDLPGSHTATEFVGWYNGHPDYRDREFDLSHETAVVIGQGNVASDISRILSKSVDELRDTDIAAHALEVLAESRVREIYIIGRRGPAQAKFTSKELKEFGELSVCSPVVDSDELVLNPESQAELDDKSNAGSRKIYELFTAFAGAEASGKRRRCHFTFLKSPRQLSGTNRLDKVVLERNCLQGQPFRQTAAGTGELLELPAGILFRSIGYRGIPIPGVPFDEASGVFPNTDGRITTTSGRPLAGLYAAGWIKRGPTGIIGTNRADSVATVEALLADLGKVITGVEKPGAAPVLAALQRQGVRTVSYADWERVDQAEVERGMARGKPREKFTSVEEILALLG